MNSVELIKKALDQYWIHIHMGEPFDQEQKIRRTLCCRSYIADNGKIDPKWLLDNRYILEEVFEFYSNSLKQEIEEAYSQDDVCSQIEERRQILRMLKYLRDHLTNILDK